jgi:hypothetical protein
LHATASVLRPLLSSVQVLVLVGTDRLDRPLTIGQMQGRFQPVLLPGAGHAVQEDEPERTAEALATFIKRFRLAPRQLLLRCCAVGQRRLTRPAEAALAAAATAAVLANGAASCPSWLCCCHASALMYLALAARRIGEPPLQIPRPAAGVPPVLPVAMGPAFVPQQSQKPG